MDVIHINKILINKKGTLKLPFSWQNVETPSAVHNLGSTTPNKLLNYKDVVNNIDVNYLKTFETGLRVWSCKESPFVNRDHGYILDEPEWPLLGKSWKILEFEVQSWEIWNTRFFC